jgi:hypothetical protein
MVEERRMVPRIRTAEYGETPVEEVNPAVRAEAGGRVVPEPGGRRDVSNGDYGPGDFWPPGVALSAAAVVPPDGQGVGVGEQGTGLAGGGLAGAEHGHPGLAGESRSRVGDDARSNTTETGNR